MAITRLSGGTTPPNGSDPRTFPAIWNDAVDDIEALELPITAARIADGAVTAPKLANTAGAVMVFDDATDRATAIPTPVEGMVTYLKDTDEVDKFDGSAFVPVGIAPAILQVVQETTTTVTQTNSPSFINTASVVTITPSSVDSKILLIFQCEIFRVFAATVAEARIFTPNVAGTALPVAMQLTDQNLGAFADVPGMMTFLHSPATTSPITYRVGLKTSNNTARISNNQNFIAMEVSG